MQKSIFRQVVFWCLLWSSVIFTTGGFDLSSGLLVRVLVVALAVTAVVWLNLAFLLPRFYVPKQYLAYAAAGIFLTMVLGRISTLIVFNWLKTEFPAEFFQGGKPVAARGVIFFIPILISLIGSTLYEVSQFLIQKDREAARLRAEKLEAEIKFLKSQTNPHFLFNALNNIYTLTLLKSDAAAENLLKLSDMLRYMLYDCSAPRVPLRKEIEYLRNFIDLFRLKDSSGIDIRLHLDERRPEMPVAPLIFIPFVENAFKHGDLEKIGKGWVDIRLTTSEHDLVFEVKNSLPTAPKSKDMVGGIGLENVRWQLNLIYPGRHQIETRSSETTFDVFLKIEI